MARNQITISLSGVNNLVIPYSNEISLRSLNGTYRREGSNLLGTPIYTANTHKLFTWQLSIPQSVNNAAILRQMIYLQEAGALGNAVLTDEAQAIPTSWLAWGNKTATGAAQDHGGITERFFFCPVAILIDPQFEQAIGSAGGVNWWRNAITAEELPA
jgi:hypothetical protein